MASSNSDIRQPYMSDLRSVFFPIVVPSEFPCLSWDLNTGFLNPNLSLGPLHYTGSSVWMSGTNIPKTVWSHNIWKILYGYSYKRVQILMCSDLPLSPAYDYSQGPETRLFFSRYRVMLYTWQLFFQCFCKGYSLQLSIIRHPVATASRRSHRLLYPQGVMCHISWAGFCPRYVIVTGIGIKSFSVVVPGIQESIPICVWSDGQDSWVV